MSLRPQTSFVINLIGCIAIAVFINGCASTMPKPEFSKQIAPESQIASTDEAKVQVETGKNASMIEAEKTRMTEKIKQKIDERKMKNSSNSSGKTYEIVLVITKYEKGNAFARAMLAGLGKIHINGDFPNAGTDSSFKFLYQEDIRLGWHVWRVDRHRRDRDHIR